MSGEDKCFNETIGETIHTAFQQKIEIKKSRSAGLVGGCPTFEKF